MGGKIDKTITIIEGRERNKRMLDELIAAIEKAGLSVNLIKHIDEDKAIENRLSEDFTDIVLWRGPANESSAAIIDRIQAWINHNAKITMNTSALGGRINTSNKMYQHGSFSLDPYVREHTLPMYPAISRDNVERLIKAGKINYPFLLKPDLGVRGEGIVLVGSKKDLDGFNKKYSAFSVEPYVESEYNWRTFVIGGVAYGCMRKTGNDEHPEDFVIKSGGQTHEKEEDKDICMEISKIATKAASASALQYAGIDLIRDDENGKFIVLETNVSGGWQNGYLKSTGVDIPTKITEWFVDRIELFERPTEEAVKHYVERRLELVPEGSQRLYKEVLGFEYKNTKPRDICSIDLQIKDIPLNEKLISAYVLIQDENLKESDKIRIQDLISTIEKYEISGFGNFIGKDCGVMEDAIFNTALYLAICSKLKAV